MSDATRIATTYIDTWNAADEAQRRRLFQQHWTDDATYVDPLMRGAGAQQISGLVGAVHERFPGFRFALTGTPNGHGDYVRLSWSLGPDGRDAPIEGSDVVQLRDGKIAGVVGFIDNAPAAA